jgi:hypothetical protein
VSHPVNKLAITHTVIGGSGLLILLGSYLYATEFGTQTQPVDAIDSAAKAVLLLAVYCLLPSLICGLGLLCRQRWAWAASLTWSTLLLLVFPIGTVLGGYGWWALLKHPVTPNTDNLPHDGEASPTAWLGLASVALTVAAILVLLLRASFWFIGIDLPHDMSSLFRYVAIALGCAYLLLFVATLCRKTI